MKGDVEIEVVMRRDGDGLAVVSKVVSIDDDAAGRRATKEAFSTMNYDRYVDALVNVAKTAVDALRASGCEGTGHEVATRLAVAIDDVARARKAEAGW